ncbi:hypothetical protein NADFUDRAFT_27614 [Nadsonia fulvescens var. elongata DSM 6958]|uniref:Outer spore wall protein RRT8 n=1 Tax=Nadsonia fulvescens var. elongata DSM 6958 TaxID=857566 RepID=A0A1E3PG86_9ASCO|nr:hypothetical protein NADFUDRAFT_27614 [Nadsonia fulvescens var. elongata DSM 6958]
MFVCLYPFHAIFGLALNGPSGLFTSGISLFFECSVVAGMLSNWLLLPGPLKSLFDSVLVKEGYHDLVLKGKLRRSLKLPWEIRMKQAIIANAKGIFLPLWIIKILIIFFLNFIPVLGPIFMVVIKGPKNGAVAHSAYFQMRGFNKKQRDTWIRRRKGAYIGFGITAGIFTSLPLLGILFNFSNCAGAALWAVEFERKRALVLSSTPESPTFQSQLKRVLGLDTQ